MNKKTITLIGIGIVLLILIFSFIGSYNGLVASNQKVQNSWSDVENQLQRRADLIPNLVETVKAYASHEKQVFADVANARSKLIGAKGVENQANANAELSSALSRLLAISEAYPQLKADANFRSLQDELAGTENRIARSRELYNETSRGYNTKIKSFPTIIIANSFGFKNVEYFKASEGSKEVPKVNFK